MLLYHGTTKEFHDQDIEKLGRFQGNYGIYLDERILTPLGYANARASEFGASPLVLIVDFSRISSRVIDLNGMWKIDYLVPEDYLALDVPNIMENDDATEFFDLLARRTKERFNLEFHL
tara:strand:+ start:187 stop:543 length:357 start_codon:yes stop_codon:yes gene_type:complete